MYSCYLNSTIPLKAFGLFLQEFLKLSTFYFIFIRSLHAQIIQLDMENFGKIIMQNIP